MKHLLLENNRILNRLREDLLSHNRIWLMALFIWLLCMVLCPLVGHWGGQTAYPIITTITVISQSLVSVAALRNIWPKKRVFKTIIVLLIGAWAAEAIGVATGLPFGQYTYTASLGP